MHNTPSNRATAVRAPASGHVSEIVEKLAFTYPDASCSLAFANPLQLLIATILSAQCTDERVNQVTPTLFECYPSAEAFSNADTAELEAAIRSTGFYRTKARNIRGACRIIVEEFGGHVPSSMAQLLRLPGVARKTANVVLSNAFHSVEGMVVDTHIGRVSRRLGLTAHKDPAQVESDLMALLPREVWLDFGHQLILHGRGVCTALRPRCGDCMFAAICPFAQGQVD